MRSLSGMLQLLVERAAPNLTADDLKKLDGGCEMAGLLIWNMNTLANGIAMLVASDTESGGLQRQEEVSDMMFLTASLLDLAWALQQMETVWLDRVPVSLASVRGMAA